MHVRHVCFWCLQRSEEGLRSSEKLGITYHICVKNQTLVFCKNNKHSTPMRNLPTLSWGRTDWVCGRMDGGREYMEGWLELLAFGCVKNLVPWKHPGIYESNRSEDS